MQENRTNNKIVVITGATGGIGTEICKYLLLNNYIILAACRNFEKGEKVRKEIEKETQIKSEEKLFFIKLDMCSFNSVDEFTLQIINKITLLNRKIDIIINNAGVIAPHFKITKDGYESSLQTNYLSAKRLTNALIPHLSTINGKIINTISCTTHLGSAIDQTTKSIEQQKKEFINLKNYSNSKLLLSLYTTEINNKLCNTFVCNVDPGIVNTGIITMHRWYDPLANILFRPFIKSAAKGAIPMIHAIEYEAIHTNTPLLFRGTKHIAK
ncbi:MAG: SDR family NAD(P)-dependent oxidoreductase [Bacteroidales bacterium]